LYYIVNQRTTTISGEILSYNIAEKYSINSSRISPHLLIYLVHIWNHNYLGFFPSILPLKLECMLITPNLPSNMENWFELSGFMKMSAGWSLVPICSGWTNPLCTLSRTTWQSISICFVLSWNTGFEAIWIATLLLQNNLTGRSCLTFRSFKMYCSHVISQHVVAMERYSASALERDTMVCFFVFHEMGAFPRKMQ
jgi:hypothetical protein